MPFRDPLECKNKVRQKLCCDKLCEIAALKKLVDGTLERDFTFGADSLKRIFQVSFTKLYYEQGCM